MTESIISYVFSFASALLVALIAQHFANKSTKENIVKELEKRQAVTDTKLEELTREVRLHNGFAQRMPVVEEQMKVVNHRLADLERKDA